MTFNEYQFFFFDALILVQLSKQQQKETMN